MGPHEQVDVLLQALRPSESSNERRKAICSFVEGVVQALLPGARLMGSGSYTSRTYLPTSDIDLVLFTSAPDDVQNNQEMNYILQVFQAICIEISARDAAGAAMAGQSAVPMTIRNAEFINARTKVCHCLVNNLGVDITINQLGALKTVVFMEECDIFIGQNHLFKRAVLLVKAWAMLDSPEPSGASAGPPNALSMAMCRGDSSAAEQQCTGILGSKTGMLSSYAVSVLVLHLFNRFPALNHPLSVLHAFLHTYANFHWETSVLTATGPRAIQNGQLKADADGSSSSACSNSASNKASACLFLQPLLERFRLQVEAVSVSRPEERSDSAGADRPGCAGTAAGSLSNVPSSAGSGVGLDRPRSGSSGNLNATRRFAIRCCNIQDPVDPANNLGFSVSRSNLGILDRCLKSGLRRLNEALWRSSSYVHVKQVLPDEERGDVFNANGSSSGSAGTGTGAGSGNMSNDGVHKADPSGERDELTDMKFVEAIMPTCYREYVACLGARADMLDHPMQAVYIAGIGAHQPHGNGMLYAPKPVYGGNAGNPGGGGGHARYTSPLPYISPREEGSGTYAIEEYIRALKTRQRASSNAGMSVANANTSGAGKATGNTWPPCTLQGDLDEMWAALRDEYARRNGTYEYKRANVSTFSYGSATASVPVFHEQVPAPSTIPIPVSPDRDRVVQPSGSSASTTASPTKASPQRERERVPMLLSSRLPPRPPVRVAAATQSDSVAKQPSDSVAKQPSGVAIPKSHTEALLGLVLDTTTRNPQHSPSRAKVKAEYVQSIPPQQGDSIAMKPCAEDAEMEPVAGDGDSGSDIDSGIDREHSSPSSTHSSSGSGSAGGGSGSQPGSPIRSPCSAFAAMSGAASPPRSIGENVSHTRIPGTGIQRPTPIDIFPASDLQRKGSHRGSGSGSGAGSTIFNLFEALGSPIARTPLGSVIGGGDGDPETFIEPGSPEDEGKKEKAVAAGASGSASSASDMGTKAKKKQRKKRSISVTNTEAATPATAHIGADSQDNERIEESSDPTSASQAVVPQTVSHTETQVSLTSDHTPTHRAGANAISHWSMYWVLVAAVALMAFGMGSQKHISRLMSIPSELEDSEDSGHVGRHSRAYGRDPERDGDGSVNNNNNRGRDMRERHFAKSGINKHSGEDDHKYDDDGQLITARRSETRLSVRDNLSSKLAAEQHVNAINGYQYAHSSSIAPFTHWLKAGSSLSIGPNDILCPLNGVDLSAVYKAKRTYAAAKERGSLNLGAILESGETEEGGDLKVSEEQYQLLLGAFLRDVDIVGDANGCPIFSPEPKWVWQHNGIDIDSSNGYIYESDAGYYEGGVTPILTIKNAQRTLVDSTVAQQRNKAAGGGNVAEVPDPQLTHEGVYSCVLRFGTAPYGNPHSKNGFKQPPSSAGGAGGAGSAGAAPSRSRSTASGGAPYNPLAEAAAAMDAIPISGRNRNTYSSILSKDGHLLGYNNDLGLTFAMKNKYAAGEESGGKGGKMMVQEEYFEILVTQVAVRVSTMPVVTTKLTRGVHYELFEGQNLFVGVNAESFPPPSYQWYQNGNKLEGETRSFLQVIDAQSSHGGAYTCEISNLAGSVTFEDVSVSVKKAPKGGHTVAHAAGGGSRSLPPRAQSIHQAHQHQQEIERANPASQARQDALQHARSQAAQSQALRDELLKGGYPNLNSNPRPVPPRRRADEEKEGEESVGPGGEAGKRSASASLTGTSNLS